MKQNFSQKHLSILKILRTNGKPLTSPAIGEAMKSMGYDISERTIRAYLLDMDRAGFTQNFGKKGRQITPLGIRELESSRVYEKVGFLSAKIENLTYLMDFNINDKSGCVVINVSVVNPIELYENLELVFGVFEKGYAMGELVTIIEPGERYGTIEIPDGKIGIGTVCSITLNGVLLKYGVPVHSKFGGLLELIDGKPSRFVEIINYDATTIDPLEIFIRGGMTDYTGAVKMGNGRIGASFRELPAESRELVTEIAKRLEKIGLGGFMSIGIPGRSLLEIPVSEGRIGAVVIGGLNPVAILEESGSRTESKALAGLIEYTRLFHYKDLESALKRYI